MNRVLRLAWLTLAFNLGVILTGALVRSTGSGAGCGRSWPTCQGQVVPELGGATTIEFFHRVVSGVALLLVLWLVVSVFRQTVRGHPARLGAVLSGVAIVVESLIGAAIVFNEWVADDASLARSISVPLHLVNTLFLLAALTLTVFWVRGGGRLRWSSAPRSRLVLVAVVVGLVAVAGTGAVTALADTLFPKPSLLGGEEDVEHFLTRLRVLHPFVSVVVGLTAAAWAQWRGRLAGGEAATAARVVVAAVGVSIALGGLNVVFGTPAWLSMTHLAVADLLWIGWVWMSAALLAEERAAAPVPAG